MNATKTPATTLCLELQKQQPKDVKSLNPKLDEWLRFAIFEEDKERLELLDACLPISQPFITYYKTLKKELECVKLSLLHAIEYANTH